MKRALAIVALSTVALASPVATSAGHKKITDVCYDAAFLQDINNSKKDLSMFTMVSYGKYDTYFYGCYRKDVFVESFNGTVYYDDNEVDRMIETFISSNYRYPGSEYKPVMKTMTFKRYEYSKYTHKRILRRRTAYAMIELNWHSEHKKGYIGCMDGVIKYNFTDSSDLRIIGKHAQFDLGSKLRVYKTIHKGPFASCGL